MTIRQGFMVGNGADFEKCLDLAVEHGFEYVELNMDHQFARQHTDADSVNEAVTSRDLDLVVHLPYRLDAGSPREYVREGSLDELKSAIDAAAAYGAEKGVFHLQTTVHDEKWDTEVVREAMYDTARRLTEYAAGKGVEPVGENLKTNFFDASDFPDYFEQTDATACLDTGHAYVTGVDGEAQADLLREYGDRISHVHLNETRVDSHDEHLPVGMGVIDFEAIATAMRETNWSGTCTHELFTFDRSYAAAGKERFDALLAGK
jgi:sugar phosphate isomerase/epimerase